MTSSSDTAARSASSSASAAADSYIGSLISLTSKSEIRYEGVLYNINTDESSIGLRNVRSFGTEGRRKDGTQVPAGSTVYEYILFRGSDIKDLQVKLSPPAQPAAPQPINIDPAIIQSHYSRPAPSATSMPPPATGPLMTDINSHTAQMGLLGGSSFQGNLPLYQPGGNTGSWGVPPPPLMTNASGLMPMYWQGYYGLPNSLPQMHQQNLLRPPPGLSMPSSMQPSLQYPSFSSSLPTGPPNFAEGPSPLLSAASGSSSSLMSAPLAPSIDPVMATSLPSVPSTTLASETEPNKAPSGTPSVGALSASLLSLSSLASSSLDISTAIPSISNKPTAVSSSSAPYQSASQSTSSVVGASRSVRSETMVPFLVTPGQLLQFGSTTGPSTQSLQAAKPLQAVHKDVEVVQDSSSTSTDPPVPVASEPQPPILPLPTPARAIQKPNGSTYQGRQGYTYRGRERGRGTGFGMQNSRPVTKFTEEFDFTAMNEKFNKDEVWGHLGKSGKPSKDKEDGNDSEEEFVEDENDVELSKFDAKPVYNKDDFFDTISSNSFNNEQNGTTRYSEQVKIDTETFGAFSKYRGGRGGRGPGRGGRGRGGYYGRDYGRGEYGGRDYRRGGYGYNGSGRGRGVSNQAPR